MMHDSPVHRRLWTLLLAATICVATTAVPAPVRAQAVTLVPRAQYFQGYLGEEYEDLPTALNFGGSVILSFADNPWAVSATGFYGFGDMTTALLSTPVENSFRRIDANILAEYQPPSSQIAMLVGVRYFQTNIEDESLTTNFEIDYTTRAILAEVGLKFAGGLTEESSHILTGQVTFGLGPGHYLVESSTNPSLESDAFDYAFFSEFAAGYSYFFLPFASVGLRVRGLLLYFNAQQAYGAGIGPELNFSIAL